jgi:RES domain-containing protein
MGAGVHRRRDGSAASGAGVSAALPRGEIGEHVAPFSSTVFCHVPSDRAFDPAALARPDDGRDRWGTPGERTVFLASDPGVAVAEYVRHRPANGASEERRIVGLRLNVVNVLDLRNPSIVGLLETVAPQRRLVDREMARAVAAEIRAMGICQGLLVPSMAFLDRPERFNIVIFAEHLGRDVGDLVTDPSDIGRISLDGR